MPDSQSLVERFYGDIWNRQEFAIAEELLSADFRFRGSLGSETVGIPGFLAYVQSVHATLADYRCTIEELIVDGNLAAARMAFAGIHRGALFGVAPTGKLLSWSGAAFFGFAHGRIISLWVLGDIDGLKEQLRTSAGPLF